MSTLPLVYAITLNWNQREETIGCLQSLHQISYANLRLLLVDNASTDETVTAVAQHFSTIEVIVNECNLGFGGGFNVGLRLALAQGAEYILIINNDARLAPDALNQMLALAQPDVGMIAPKIYYASQPQRIWSLGGQRHPLTYEMTGDARGQLDTGQWERVLERDYFVGCIVLLSARMLREIGLFNEQFFLYYEDSDLSLRARQAGYRLLLCPQAYGWHKVSISSGGSDSPNERYWMGRSSVIFFRRHVTGLRWGIVFPYRIASAVKTVTRLSLAGRRKSAAAYLRGLRDGWREQAH
jgi:GT2 family glycosyltransferase